MKWLKIIIALAEMFIPFWSKVGKNKLADELEVCRGVLEILTTNMTPAEKGRVIQEAVGNLKAAKKFKARVSEKIGKAGDRLIKKFL